MKQLMLLLLFVVCFRMVNGQQLPLELWHQPWKAYWIAVPGTDPKAYGVYKFRKTFTLTAQPDSLWVHLSGDNRYQFFVNGKLLSMGPARGDLYFWNFETVNIAPLLQRGENVLSAVVWNDGPQKPEAQISYRSAFILQSNHAADSVVNTDASWRCMQDSSYAPRPVSVPGYYVAGPAEWVRMDRHIRGWQGAAFQDSGWKKAATIFRGLTKGSAVDARGWMLVPSPLPQMEVQPQRFLALRDATGVSVPDGFPSQQQKVTVPPNTRAVLLLDNGTLTNAYPVLQFSGGAGAAITMGYAEALYMDTGRIRSVWDYRVKGNRDDVAAKKLVGKADSITSDGSQAQVYQPLWWRTYRYLELTVNTGTSPLVIDDVYGVFTGYPFRMQATLQTPDAQFGRMLDVGWRTARLCAFETYMDCPYYEQLQYIGDARIQALVSYFNSGDDRLARHALNLMDRSRIAEGITLSRYPTDLHQQIPTFSLWYIAMLHDYWRYRPDATFIKEKLAGTRQILHFFQQYQQADGSLKNLPYWIFTDWVEGRRGWRYGIAPRGASGTSAVLDLQLAWVYNQAAEMEAALGLKELAADYRRRAEQLKATANKKYWDNTRGLYADTEEHDLFSQHANTLALLSGAAAGKSVRLLAQKTAQDTSLAPASIYFKYYLHAALVGAGLGNDYLGWLDKWRENLALGLTTWAEMSDVSRSRSDCHAWGSSPNIEFYRTVLGLDSDAPGFKKVKVAPHLGTITNISGTMPHPAGTLSASYRLQGGVWQISIGLPPATTGTFIWKGAQHPLRPGTNKFTLR